MLAAVTETWHNASDYPNLIACTLLLRRSIIVHFVDVQYRCPTMIDLYILGSWYQLNHGRHLPTRVLTYHWCFHWCIGWPAWTTCVFSIAAADPRWRQRSSADSQLSCSAREDRHTWLIADINSTSSSLDMTRSSTHWPSTRLRCRITHSSTAAVGIDEEQRVLRRRWRQFDLEAFTDHLQRSVNAIL